MVQEFGPLITRQWIRPRIYKLVIALPQIAQRSLPGQFVHLLIPDHAGVLLRRPLSIAAVRDDHVELLIRIVGTGTEALSRLPVGSTCDVIGPLGQGFRLEGVRAATLVAGGIGVAPLLILQEELGRRGMATTFFCGARTHEEFPVRDEEVSSRQIIPSTDDGTYGEPGLVSAALERWLESNSSAEITVFSCGPTPMIKAVQRICSQHQLPHQTSLENRMACGVGVCQGCALKLAQPDERGGYRLVCKDGPVFDAAELDWTLFP